MVTNQERKNVDEALKKICAHRLFVSSPTHTRLLTYLVEKAFAGEELNEVTIGSDLYGIDYSKDSSNGTVRSYMYKLRKKLAEYYDETGQNDTIIFDIEKGQYNLKFVSAKEIKQTNSGKTLTFHIPVKYLMAAIALLLVLSTIAVFVIHYSNSPGILWQPFFSSKSQNLVVISDHFVVNQQLSDGEEHAILYSEITNVDAFLKYSEKHPETELKTTDYTLMSKMAPFAIKPLTEWFLTNNHDFSLKLESKLTYEDVRDYNIIFIGQFKTMNLSRSLFLKNSKVFSTFGDGFKYKTSDGEQIYNTKFGQNENVEYAMVSFTSLSPGKTALYFASNNDIGVLATIRNFTNKQWLKEFTKNLPEGTGFFNALFEVSGIQRNDVSCKLVKLEKVKE